MAALAHAGRTAPDGGPRGALRPGACDCRRHLRVGLRRYHPGRQGTGRTRRRTMAEMQYRRFGRTGLQVSIMGLGSGGPSQLGQSSGVPEEDAHRVVRRALDLGINLIDTAADYRDSEAILGRALRGVPRDSYVLCTKFNPVRGRTADPADESALKSEQDFLDSLERSLQRLGTDHVDLLELHGGAAA